MTLINIVLTRYTVPGPARYVGKRGNASGPPEILLLMLIWLFKAGEERKPNKAIENYK